MINKFKKLHYAVAVANLIPHGDGGNDDAPTKEQMEALQQQLSDAQSSITKLEDKNKQVIGEKKEIETKMKAWEGLDPENVRGLLDKFENDEELKLIAEGKHSEVIEKRIEKAEADFKSKLETLTTENGEYKTQLDAANATIKDLLINQNVTAAFVGEKGLESAIPDVVLRAKAEFQVEDGKPVARDGDGKIITGKEGPLTISEWVGNLKESAPHLFPASEGAGGAGNRGGANQSNIDGKMAAAASAGNMTEYRRLRALKKQGKKEA
jgi:hypothetical protein